MKEIYSLVIEGKSEDMGALIEEISLYCIESRKTQSSTGMEIATLVISALGLLISLMSVPALVDAIDNKKVVVKVGGVTLKDTAKSILQNLKKDPELISEVKKAFESGKLEIEGTAERIATFLKELRELIDEKGDS